MNLRASIFSTALSNCLQGDFYTNPDTLRMPWANEPGCGSRHIGDTNDNMRGMPGTVNAADDLIHLVQAYLDTDARATPIVQGNKHFAKTESDCIGQTSLAAHLLTLYLPLCAGNVSCKQLYNLSISLYALSWHGLC